MKRLNTKKLQYALFFLLSLMYIMLLLGMVSIHYHELASVPNVNIYDIIWQYNWKYWFEEADNSQTLFAQFLQFIDTLYLHSKGILPIVVNIGFILSLVVLMVSIIRNIFTENDNHSVSIRLILIFSAIILLFSSLQDSGIVWMFNQQQFSAYFFPLLSYYLLIHFSVTNSNKYFNLLLVSTLMTIIVTPYYFSALVILLFIGYIFKISWHKNLLILIVMLFSLFVHYGDPASNFSYAGLFSRDMIANNFLYILNYLGSLFIYVSFEPCLATSSVVAGVFVLGTFVYVSYLLVIQRVGTKYYWVIWAFLLFFILTAFSSLLELQDRSSVIFRNQDIMPSLIAWSLIFIFYLHRFHASQVIQRRILILLFTLVSVLYLYQIFTFQQYRKDIFESKVAIEALKLGICDQGCEKNFSHAMYIAKYFPVKSTQEKMSIFTVNKIKTSIIQERIGLLKDKEPFSKQKTLLKSSRGGLKGGLDQIISIDNKLNVFQVHGWVYDIQEKKVPHWLIILDQDKNVLGYAITGKNRHDVKMVYGNNATKSGFTGYIKYVKKPTMLLMIDASGKNILKIKYLNKK